MDELTQNLRRQYIATGAPLVGAKYMKALLRTSVVRDEIFRRASTEYGSQNVEFIYIGWIPDQNYVRFVVLVKKYELEIAAPTPRIREHMEEWEYYNYENSWTEYNNQTRGVLHFLVYDYSYTLGENEWELQEYEYLDGPDPESTTMEKIRNRHYPTLGGTIESAEEDDIVILNRLHENITFADELPELEEEPVLETGRCEDYPACGHDICPDRWSTGQQADMKCVCGASVPITSRYSICNTCLNAPDPDDPYGRSDDYGDYGDYCTQHACAFEDCPGPAECEECGKDPHDCECELEY